MLYQFSNALILFMSFEKSDFINQKFSKMFLFIYINLVLMFYNGVKIRTCFYVKNHQVSWIASYVRDSREILTGLYPQFQSPSRRKKEVYAGFKGTKGRYEGHIREKRETIGGNVNQRTIHSGTHFTILLFLRLVDWWYRSQMEMCVIFITSACSVPSSTDRDATTNSQSPRGLLTSAFP